MIPDYMFEDALNNSLLLNDMRHVKRPNDRLYEKSQKDYTIIVIISAGCLLVALIFLISLCILLEGFLFRHTVAYYHIIVMINMNCALWYINCKAIKIASQSLSDCFCREQEARDMLSSQDGDTCEVHDQFYRDHKLLLVLFRVLAVMPITRSSPGTITFSWKSSATIYAICFYIATTMVVLVVGYERLMILGSIQRFDDYIYAILFVVFLVPHFWIPFVGWGVAHQVAIYKTSWGKFQVRYYRVTGEDLQFPNLKTIIVIISAGCLLVALIFLISLCILLEGFLFRHTVAYYHIIVMINMNCALWYINCKAIKIASQSLSDCFCRDVQVSCSAQLIARYRFLWLNLSELLQSLGNAYARTYSTYCLFMFTNITIAVYGALSEIIDHGFGFSFKEMGLFVDTLYCSTLLFIFADCSHNATQKVAAGVQDTLLSIDVLNVDRPTQKEVDHFIQAIEMNPAVVDLKGYAHVNRELLTSAINMIAIYLIVLLQFKISLPKDPTTS